MPEYTVGEARADMASNISTLLKSIVFWLKVLELGINIIVIGLLTEGGFVGNTEKAFVSFGTPYAYILINLIIIAAMFLEEPLSKRLTMVITGGGGVLFVTAGALIIEFWVNANSLVANDLSLGSGILAIILGAIYLADTGYSFKFA